MKTEQKNSNGWGDKYLCLKFGFESKPHNERWMKDEWDECGGGERKVSNEKHLNAQHLERNKHGPKENA